MWSHNLEAQCPGHLFVDLTSSFLVLANKIGSHKAPSQHAEDNNGHVGG
jgi:hypothetical protein